MIKPNIVNMKFGSHLYGLSTPNSDVDYKGIYMPPLREIILGKHKSHMSTSTGDSGAKNKAGDIDIEVFSLDKFLALALKGETVAIDMLHCTSPISTSVIWDDLISQRTLFYSKSLKSFVGYVRRQAAKYGIKGSRLSDINKTIAALKVLPQVQQDHRFTVMRLRDVWDRLYEGEYAKKQHRLASERDTAKDFYEVNGKLYQDTMSVQEVLHSVALMRDKYGERASLAEKNDGVDWKATSHALRAGYQARDIYKDGDFEYPLKETDFLLQVKQGKLDFKTEVASVLEELVDEVERLSETSTLPERPDKEHWDNWLLNIYSRYFGIKQLRITV